MRHRKFKHDPDYCCECQGYGNDCYENEDGELVSACGECRNKNTKEEKQ